jgi:RHS repeat-associated protein
MPKGGGAIRGIGEKFGTNPVMGSASMTIPIFASPGRSGFAPQLTLSYDSGAGNGPFGLGWNLPIRAITRETHKGLPQYRDDDESDVFVLAGAEELVPFLVRTSGDGWKRDSVSRVANGEGYRVHRYRPRIEGSFTLIEKWVNDRSLETHWRTVTGDNVTTLFGVDSESRIADRNDPSRIFSWLVSQTCDDKGNVVVYTYKPEDYVGVDVGAACERNRDHAKEGPQRYLKRISYGNTTPYTPDLVGALRVPLPARSDWMFELVFDYGDHEGVAPKRDETATLRWTARSDPFSTCRPGFEVRTHRLCQRILMFHHFPGESGVGADCLVRSTDFAYLPAARTADPSGPPFTHLQRAWQTSYKRRAAPATGYLSRATPPVEFTYSRPIIDDAPHQIESSALANLPVGISGSGYQLVDLDSEGLPGVLSEHAGGWFYRSNLGRGPLGPTFGPASLVAQRPSFAALGAGRQRLLDLAGDGELDLVDFGGTNPGLQERSADGTWRPFRPFASLPNIDWNAPDLRFIDLTGDGSADALIADDEVFTWYPSLAEEGFAAAECTRQPRDEEQGPHIVFADGTQTIFTADMSGDGLHDLVRIRNGEVSVWGNLGYGQFGARIAMDNAPWFDAPDRYDPARIRLADVDGSGTTDIIYLGDDGARLHINRSGNSLSDARVLPFPTTTDHASVQVADLLGNGTACLVWSSALPGHAQNPAHYLDLMGGQKPHLLVTVRNNLGAETRIDYAPSTKFYLADKLAGTPWITRLPFPVHVVERVTVADQWRNTTFSTRYSYHHGVFDGEERELRGFARVEQVDVEDFGLFVDANVDSPYITSDRRLLQPPINTITWIHTGTTGEHARSLAQLQGEYFPNSLAALPNTLTTLAGFRERAPTQPTIEAADLNAEEWCEAMRACKGTTLRQEIFELDVDALETAPGKVAREIPVRLYSAATHNCLVRRIQPRIQDTFAVFQVLEGESLTYEYELDLRPATLPVDPTKIPPVRPDPRVTHTVNLSFDAYGNVQRSVVIGYRRMQPFDEPELVEHAALIRAVQAGDLLSYTETRHTDPQGSIDPALGATPIQYYRLPVQCDVETYELTGITPSFDTAYFTLADFLTLDLSVRYRESGALSPVARKAYHELPQPSLPAMRLVEHTRTLFFEDTPSATAAFLNKPLPLGRQGRLGLIYENYKLALTAPLLQAVLAEKFDLAVRTSLDTPTASGYLSGARFVGAAATDEWWIGSGTAGFAADADKHFYLPERYTDPFGNVTILHYDRRDLFVRSSRDPLGNTASVVRFDYRVLAPTELEDLNGNRTVAYFDLLARVVAVALMGKGTEADDLVAYDDALANPSSADLAAVFAATPDVGTMHRMLGRATTRFLYHFGEAFSGASNWMARPADTCAIARERHVATLVGPERSALQVEFECSDGLGSVLMKRSQAEPERIGGPRRWIVTGKTVFNNKGKPVKQYEPHFSDHATFTAESDPHEEVGETSLMYYDAAGRPIRTEMPDGTFSRVEFSPWLVRTFDANDTVTQSEWYKDRGLPNPTSPLPAGASADTRAAWLAARHAGTPSLRILDSLGRDVIVVAHDRVEDATGPLVFGGKRYSDARYVTFTKLDAEGRPLWIRDARRNLVMQYLRHHSVTAATPISNTVEPTNYSPAYDIAGNLLFQHSMDAGDRWMLNDSAGKPMLVWDFNRRLDTSGAFVDERRRYSTTYDALHRPVAQWLVTNTKPAQMVERWDYVDIAAPGPLTTAAAARARNLCGQMYRHFDPAGLVQVEHLDFKGNALEVSRRLTMDHRATISDWQTNPLARLEAETFTKITEFDALNRTVRLYNWHRLATTDRRVAVYEPLYNERGLLASEQLVVGARRNASTTGRRFDEVAPIAERNDVILGITYNAQGQRLSLALGSGTTTLYDYDPKTFRLRQLRTTRRRGARADPPFPAFASNLADERVLQQLHYTYDPVGNIVAIKDEAYRPVYWAGGIAVPISLFEYDPLYRLRSASGRETAHGGSAAVDGTEPAITAGFPITDQTLRQYTQSYQYDPVGNLVLMRHVVSGDAASGWTHHYENEPDSNRLHATWTGSSRVGQIEHQHDAHGNMLNMAQVSSERFLRWDDRDMIASIDLGGGGMVYYQYDAGKQRTRKRIDNRTGGGYWERIDLGGYELYRRYVGTNHTPVDEVETLHLMVSHERLLMVDEVLQTTTAGLTAGNLYRYSLSNHLGSSTVELDDRGAVISHEEFHPYGSTAYRSGRNAAEVKLKRYRFTGMERDEESGFSYHGARFLSVALARWTSPDPIGPEGGLNRYGYCFGNPLRHRDWSGRAPTFSPAAVSERTYQELLVEFLAKAGGAVLVSDPLKSVDANGLDAIVLVGRGKAVQVVLGDAKHAQFSPGSNDVRMGPLTEAEARVPTFGERPAMTGTALNATGKESGPGLISSFETAKKNDFVDVISDINAAQKAGKIDAETAAEAIASLRRGEAHFNIGVSGYNVDAAASVKDVYGASVIRYDQYAEATAQRARTESAKAVLELGPRAKAPSTARTNKIGNEIVGDIETRAEARLLEQSGAKVASHFPVFGFYLALGLVEEDLNHHDVFNAAADLVAPVPLLGEFAWALQGVAALGMWFVPTSTQDLVFWGYGLPF